MARPVVDIRAFGARELERNLSKFIPRVQKKIVRQALAKSSRRIYLALIQNLSGSPVAPDTGRWLIAQAAMKPEPISKHFGRSRGLVGRGIPIPERSQLGIGPKDKWYYPYAVEYGYTRTKRAPVTVEAKRPIRRAVDDRIRTEHAMIGRDIGRGITREAKKVLRMGV